MTKSCAIFKCHTGCRITNEKYSVFRVPKDVERYKKWLAVVPGLKQSQFVCEKHFEKQFIIREWKKVDANGRIIAQVAYIKPKLDQSAVPSIFEDDEEVQQPTSNAMIDEPMHEIFDTLPLLEHLDVKIEDSTPLHVTDAESAQNASHKGILLQPLMDEDPLGPSSPTETKVTSTDDFLHDVTILPQESRQSEVVVSNDSMEFEVLPLSEVAAVVSYPHELASVPACCSEVAESHEVPEKSVIHIPKSWDIKRKSTERGRSIVFIYWVTKRESGIEVPVVEKTVVVATGGSIHYFVYGRIVDPDVCELDSVLSQIMRLPAILERFKNLNVCVGIGAVNVLHFSADSAYKDYVDRWRQKDCMLVWKRKRCNNCITMRKLALKRERISKENAPLTRINKASNPIHRKKLLAQRKKISNEKRLKNRAKHRVQILTQSLKRKRK